jgi:hypothetical protein
VISVILTQTRLLGKRIRRHHLTEPRAARVVTSSEAIGDDQRARGEKNLSVDPVTGAVATQHMARPRNASLASHSGRRHI